MQSNWNSHTLLAIVVQFSINLPVSYELKHILTILSRNHTPGYLLRNVKAHIHIKGCIMNVSSRPIHNWQKLETSQMTSNRLVEKQTVITYKIIESYSLIKRNKLVYLFFDAKPWMNLRGIMLNERS